MLDYNTIFVDKFVFVSFVFCFSLASSFFTILLELHFPITFHFHFFKNKDILILSCMCLFVIGLLCALQIWHYKECMLLKNYLAGHYILFQLECILTKDSRFLHIGSIIVS